MPALSKLTRIFPKQMWLQVAIVLVAMVTIPTVILGALLMNTSREAMNTSVTLDHGQLAVRAASEVELFVEKAGGVLTATASILGTLPADPWRQETVLVELALGDDQFGRISALDGMGREVATSKLGTPLRDRSEEIGFLRAINGEFYTSEMYLSAEREPYVTMAVPVRRAGETVGVLIAQVRLRGMWNIVDQIKIGDTGRAFVVDRRGTIVAHPDKKKVMSSEKLSDDRVIEAIASGRSGSVTYTDPRNIEWLMSYAPMTTWGWGLVIRQTEKEAFAFARVMERQSWLIILFGLVIAVSSSIWIAGRLVRPIKNIKERTEDVARGEFDRLLAVERKDEIGDLMHAFNEMMNRLKQAKDSERLTAVGKAASAIAHDLKNSLVMVNTFVQLFPRKKKDPDFLEKFSRVVPRELDSWKSMLQELSDYARHSTFDVSLIQPVRWLENLSLLVEERAAQLNIEWSVRVPEKLPPIIGSEQKLNQAMLNLIGNALESMRHGGRLTLSAEIRYDSKDGRENGLTLRVEDTGAGIPEDVLPHIFDPFHTTKASGLGLGLSITRDIIGRHGGQIQIDSVWGKGTTATIMLPGSLKR